MNINVNVENCLVATDRTQSALIEGNPSCVSGLANDIGPFDGSYHLEFELIMLNYKISRIISLYYLNTCTAFMESSPTNIT